MIYAGIGSRKISVEEEIYITDLAKKFSEKGFILYSGHADGADMAFEKGADPDKSVIWLPWEGFNGKLFTEKAFVVGGRNDRKDTLKYHPNYKSLYRSAKGLMIRNSFQVLGDPPVYPMVDFVVCCSDPLRRSTLGLGDGVQGGTGHAIRIANAYYIPWFNIRVLEERKRLEEFLSVQEL